MELYTVLKQINFERLAGSEGEKKARDIFKKYLTSWKLKVSEHAFDMYCFETGQAEIKAGKTVITALPLGLSKTVNLSGELYFMENSDEMFLQKGMYKDKIILTFTRSAKLMNRLVEEQIKGIIFISEPYKKPMATNLRQKIYEDGSMPAVSIAYSDAKKLLKHAGSKITINIKETTKKKKAKNIVVDIPGTSADTTLTCICAHYDTVATSCGSNDNGAGSVIILKIAEYFAAHPPLRPLRIIFFSGEEMGLLGSFAYTKDHKDELMKRMGLLINVDVSGDDIGINDFKCLGTNEMLGYVDGVLKEAGFVFRKGLGIYSSDCMPFSAYEIPSINMSRWGGESTYHIHTIEDTAEKVTQHGLEDTYNATLVLLSRILNAKFYPIKPEIDATLKEKIEEYLYNTQMTEPKLEWKKKYEK